MNNAKMWLVVKPTVGVPIFLAGVAIGSFAVHVAVMTNTTWIGDFLQGEEMGSSAQTAMILDDQDLNPVKPANFEPVRDGDRLTVILPDGQRAVAVIDQPDTLATVSAVPGIRRE